MAAARQGKIQNLVNYQLRITLNDGRQMTGQMLAFDKHMNLVLADCEEFRRIRKRAAKQGAPGGAAPLVETEEKRTLGLTIVRGTTIVSLSVDGPPPADPSARLRGGIAGPGMAAGPGVVKPAGRGLPSGLQGPVATGPGPAGFGGAGFASAPGFGGRGGPRELQFARRS